MTKKVLFCATVDYHFKAFHLPYLKWFKEQGWEVHVAASGTQELPFVDQKFTIPIQRSPFHIENIKAYRQLKRLIDDNQYEIVHCHTPMGGALGRLAARAARKKHGTKVLYTAHGFHFCKGAPLASWLIYYPIEKILSRVTDCLITINQEDFRLAQGHRFKAQQIKHIHGVGVNTDRYYPVGREQKLLLRTQYGYQEQAFLMIYAAEFNQNKNQQLLIKALSQIKDQIPQAKLLLAGDGPLLLECKQLATQLGVESIVDFLGHRQDVEQLLKISDLAVASSLREGLPVNIMEAMACGLPVIASDNRGHRELIQQQQNGWIIENENIPVFANQMIEIAADIELQRKFGMHAQRAIQSTYSLQKVQEEMNVLYQEYAKEGREIAWAVQ